MIPVALSMDVVFGDIVPVRHEGQELVLWRDEEGMVHGWEDRCPHRGVRLSLGFIRNNRLACLYHGWQYDREGRCRAIPAHPSLNPPSTIRTRNFHVEEKAGLIWIAMENEVDRPLVPAAEGTWHGVRSLAIRAKLAALREALVLNTGQWRQSSDRLLALHSPEEGVTMVHLAVNDVSARAKAAAWLLDLRDSLEEIRC
ncbi:Rieske (2Fe-2S) protein [Asaia sp. BMEF1]|uniref:Rieske 2Fe-2S domain-containing protein n=1 Tax=Asaia sp. BMEF1 TaxID=3155932 RepID=UPI003F67FD7D